MLATRRDLLKLAAEARFETSSLEKVMRLGDLLGGIAEHARLAQALVLKGGTALNLFFGLPTRLSVDLDFNYIGKLERSEMLRDRPLVESDIERIVAARGYALQRSVDTHAGRTFNLSYRRIVDGLSDRITLDVNFLHRQCLLQTEVRHMWQPSAPGGGPQFPIVSFDELAAGKLIALLDRAAPRDAWDVSRLVSISDGRWPGSLSRSIFVAMAGVLPHPLHSYTLAGLSRIRDRDVKRLLHPLMIQERLPSGEDLRRRAGEALAPLLDLLSAEREYCDRLQRGELVPELLFPKDPELASRVASSPPLIWKALNAKEHLGRREGVD